MIFGMDPKDLLFLLSCGLAILHYSLVFLSTKMKISEKYIDNSHKLLEYVIAAWIGSIIGGANT